jgi:glycosyltransferase involved in cell wall biosynthesis
VTLTVLSVAYPFAPVGPDAVGGAEQVLSSIDGALTRANHRSLVIAREDSKVDGTLVPIAAHRGAVDGAAHYTVHEQVRETIRHALEHWPVDLVHMHGADFYRYLPPEGVPTLATLHMPPDWYPPEVFRPERAGTFLLCVSANQRRRCPASAALLPEIANGVPVERFEIRRRKRPFTTALGRICPEKGFHLAIDAARQADVTLLLGGRVFEHAAHRLYFAREIQPRLDRRRRFIGAVPLRHKRGLLGAARCLLVPSLVDETSSLVAMEALACGTPVIAFRAGALPEIVEHGSTGFVVAGEREMAEAIDAVGALDPDTCRAAAQRRFSSTRMAGEYLALYARLTGAAA